MGTEESTQKVEERLTGGMVLARDHTNLRPGELGLSTSCHYKSTTDGLVQPPSRTALSLVGAEKGLYGIDGFGLNGIGRRLVAAGTSSYFTADPATSPYTWTNRITGLTGGSYLKTLTALDPVTARDRCYLVNGTDAAYCLYNKNTAIASRLMGLQPVTATPYAVTGAGTWSLTGIGYYEYWITEVVRELDSSNVVVTLLESTFSGKPVTVNVTSVNIQVTVSLPATTINSNTTHFRVYRSPSKQNRTDVLFPTGVLIADVPINTATIIDSGASTGTGAKTPTNVTSVGSWTNVANCKTIDAANATASTPGSGNAPSLTYDTFGFSGILDPVSGISVRVVGFTNLTLASVPANACTARISLDAGTTWSPTKLVPLAGTTLQDVTVGDSNDRWGLDPLPASGFSTANFRLQLTFSNNAVYTVAVDGVTVTVAYSASTLPVTGGLAFPAIIITTAEQTLSCGEDGPPPIASVLDVFEGATVCNDISAPRNLRYSIQGKLESFPTLYYDPMPLIGGDRVTCVRVLGRVLAAGGQFGLWRVNYLPTELDVNMDRGRVFDLIDTSYGPLSEVSFCNFRGPDGRTLMAYVTFNDIRATEGFNSWPICGDFPLIDEVDTSDLVNNPVILINNPENWELLLIFKPKSGGQIATSTSWTQVALRLNYHPGHIKYAGQTPGYGPYSLKCSGVIPITNKVSSTESTVSSANYFKAGVGGVWLGYAGASSGLASGAGRVYYEVPLSSANYPTTDAAPTIRGRMMFLNGKGGEWKCMEIYLHHNDTINSAAATFTLTPTWTKTGGGYVTETAKAVTQTNSPGQGVLQEFPFNLGVIEALRPALGIDANKQFSLNGYVVRGESFGESESVK